MLEHSSGPSATIIPRAALRRYWARATLVIWVISSLAYAFVLGPEVERSVVVSRTTFMPLGFWAPVGMFVPSISLGLLFAIYKLSPLSHARLFRPTRARVLGAFCLWLVLPLALVSFLPSSAGFVGIYGLVSASKGFRIDWHTLCNIWSLLIITYIISCLLCSAFPSWGRRALAFLLIWSGCLCLTFAAGTAVKYYI